MSDNPHAPDAQQFAADPAPDPATGYALYGHPLAALPILTGDYPRRNAPAGARFAARDTGIPHGPAAGRMLPRACVTIEPYGSRRVFIKRADHRQPWENIGNIGRTSDGWRALVFAASSPAFRTPELATRHALSQMFSPRLPSIGTRVLLPNYRGRTFTYGRVAGYNGPAVRVQIETPRPGECPDAYTDPMSLVITKDQPCAS